MSLWVLLSAEGKSQVHYLGHRRLAKVKSHRLKFLSVDGLVRNKFRFILWECKPFKDTNQFWVTIWICLNHYKNDLLYLSETQKSAELKQKLTFIQYAVGAVPSPFDCFLVNRGLKTLHVRMKRHGENGMAVAKWLESNERVASVSYPGLPSHPQHEVFKKNARNGVLAVPEGTLRLAQNQHLSKFVCNWAIFVYISSWLQ